MTADISLFTPTHNPRFLKELYSSLLKQENYSATWEWIILTNGPCKKEHLDECIVGDKRVKIAHSDYNTIGGLKKHACSLCNGKMMLETDHDDLLAPDTFYELIRAYNETPFGFYYSDFINLRIDGTCETFSDKFGWQRYSTTINDKKYKACRAFEPNARSICEIYYAPNHIRAWSREAYELSGGHDEDKFVGDDHDLVCRTYLAGVPFVHINKPLYIYRRHKGNTFVPHTKTIRVAQTNNKHKYLRSLILSEAIRTNGRLVDIDNVENCDIMSYEDNSVFCIKAIDVLNTLPLNQLTKFMHEAYRVLTPGGWLLTSAPATKGQDDKSTNFDYYTNKKFASLVDRYKGRFQNVRTQLDYTTKEHEESNIPYLHVDLCALKGQRQPGLCMI